MTILINGEKYSSYQEAYQTGKYLCEDLDGIREYDKEAEEYVITFPDKSWCWDFGVVQ